MPLGVGQIDATLPVAQIDATLPVAQIVDRLEAEYRAARARLAG